MTTNVLWAVTNISVVSCDSVNEHGLYASLVILGRMGEIISLSHLKPDYWTDQNG